MDQAKSRGLARKLALVGLFLLVVLVLVGREEDPGLIGRLGEAPPADIAVKQVAQPSRAVPASPPPPRRAARHEDSRALSAWYAESVADSSAGPTPIAPAPQEDSHLINDARPLVVAGPMVEAGAPFDPAPVHQSAALAD